MPQKNYRDESRKNWVKVQTDNATLSNEELQFGAILRIADATEAMAKNYVQMQGDLDYYKKGYKEQQAEIARLVKSNSAYKGHFRRLKSKTMEEQK
ncbi:MAG: hypothetical protein WC833_08775 [Bacteroidales bacterium]|jgi:hypothetical protein